MVRHKYWPETYKRKLEDDHENNLRFKQFKQFHKLGYMDSKAYRKIQKMRYDANNKIPNWYGNKKSRERSCDSASTQDYGADSFLCFILYCDTFGSLHASIMVRTKIMTTDPMETATADQAMEEMREEDAELDDEDLEGERFTSKKIYIM
jgi:hypothetical protein